MSSGLYSGVSGLALGTGLYRNVSGLWGGSSGLIDAFGGGGGPFPGASLYLDFLTPPLDSRITFSRGTNATLVDSTGKITYAPANMITNSVGPASSTGVTASTATGAAPDDTNAVRLTKTDATSPRYAGWNAPFTAQSNTRYVASAYFKYDGYDTTVSLEYNNVVHWGGTAWVAPFNVTASGITADVTANCTSGVQAIGNGWFRVWAAFTTGTVSSAVTSILTRITGASGVTVLTAWGQIEPVTYQTTPGPYVATTASAYYGPRFDYDPVTLAPRGLLIEEARTNFMTYSQQVGGTNWVSSGATSTLNNILAPDGTTTATLVTENTAASAHAVFGTSMTLTVATHTASVYIKTGTRRYVSVRGETITGSLYAWVTLDTQTGAINSNAAVTSASATSVGNGWYRLVLTWANTQGGPAAANIVIAGSDVATAPTTASTLGNSYTGTSSTFYVWGAQVELGAFATSYIPTVASTVSRSADNASMTGTNFSTWYNQAAGTFVTDFDKYSTTTRGGALCAGNISAGSPTGISLDGNSDGKIRAYIENAGALEFGDLTLTNYAANIPIKGAIAYATNNAVGSAAGVLGTVDTSVVVPTVDNLQIGAIRNTSPPASFFLNGHIRAIAYYNTRLPNTQLQTLTAPSLASPLALDFISPTYTVGY